MRSGLSDGLSTPPVRGLHPERVRVGSVVTRAVIRTCVGCRERAIRRELLRVVAGPDADGSGDPAVVPDPRGTALGRGAYLHPTTGCLALAERKRAFPRALRVAGGLSTQTLREYVAQQPAPDQ